MPNLVSEHKKRAQSIAFNQYNNSLPTETHIIAKLPPRREPPLRDKKGQFIKKMHSNEDLSDITALSMDSSPLDTPEIDQ